MAEKISFNLETGNNKEKLASPEQKKSLVEELERRASKAAEASNDEREILYAHKANEAAKESSSYQSHLEVTNVASNAEQLPPAADLKQHTYERNLHRIQKDLKGPDKTLSKVVHNKYMGFIASGVAASLGRQYGLLGAGVVGFFGSAYLYYSASSAGFSYSYFAVFGLFAIGYVIGELVEICLNLYLAKKRR